MEQSSPALTLLLLLFGGWVNRRQQEVISYLKEENRILRQVHRRAGHCRFRLTNAERRRLAVKGKALGRKLLGEVAGVVTPETILGWYRKLVARKYDGSRQRGPGRPRTKGEVVELLLTMAGNNPTWGYTRLRGALRHLGHEIGRNTIKRILQDHGIVPAPERGKQTTWKTFIKAHLGQMAEADFFTVEALTWWGPVRYFVFFIIDIETRRVEIANISHQPHQELMNQIARNLVDDEEGVLREKRYLLCDRDPLYTESFRSILGSGGVEVLQMPARSPNLRPYSERFVRTIKEECLSRVVPLARYKTFAPLYQ